MQQRLVQLYGALIAALGLVGLTVAGRHLFGIMNVDMLLDVVRVVLGASLLYVGFLPHDADTVRSALGTTGILYIGIAILGMLSPTLWGLLPMGLTGFDVTFHLLTGLVAAGAAWAPNSDSTAVTKI